ncbi:cation diffusion facilitator family transporter [Aedoeadaptatus nemausensis]|uniref:Cation diffusion facilitator family transporter n=1 Tax=Aedoeadaptatus nemausensis TaxID=2582829 RepID=A0A6V6Y6N3_9FIRM|nr:cation diffusion facilitator family transporter [Peptoniphilus nemausensis]CAC9935197.1 cation diffusion facilitator family transporter [Peptoniphilus nemausensis]
MLEGYLKRRTPNPADQRVRMAMGKEASILGIAMNLGFATFKIGVGILTGGISMIADGMNNLMDMLSSAISLIGFHFASMPADSNHPYGHARMEYLASFLVSLIILWTGGSLMWQSVKNIINPGTIDATPLAVAVLVISIFGKLFLYRYNLILGKRLDSELLVATAYDARGDVFATGAVLLSLIATSMFSVNVDGWMGLIVSVIIAKSGWETLRDTVDTLLGQKTDPELLRAITRDIKSFPVTLGVHDLMYHDYGATHRFLTLHVEVDSEKDVMDIHQDIDEIERHIEEKYHMDATIHIDPIRIDDPRSNALYDYVKANLRAIVPTSDLHDFRIVDRKDGLNLVFDVLLPMNLEQKIKDIDEELKDRVAKDHPEYQLLTIYDMDYQDLLEVKNE